MARKEPKFRASTLVLPHTMIMSDAAPASMYYDNLRSDIDKLTKSFNANKSAHDLQTQTCPHGSSTWSAGSTKQTTHNLCKPSAGVASTGMS